MFYFVFSRSPVCPNFSYFGCFKKDVALKFFNALASVDIHILSIQFNYIPCSSALNVLKSVPVWMICLLKKTFQRTELKIFHKEQDFLLHIISCMHDLIMYFRKRRRITEDVPYSSDLHKKGKLKTFFQHFKPIKNVSNKTI